MDLNEQLALCDKHAEQAYYSLFYFLREHKDQLIAGMRIGLVSGYEEYEDRTWQKTIAELEEDIMEELRDAGVYAVIALSQQQHPEWGGP